ncbi:OmpA family protein [Burkholderia territorii]|uniref:OmpA family protein n=1 Tax=Burkholderia territorii TaxID=1503055 RepID=UPI0009BE9C74|nr:OmpA family protein [Burkholderia territorii]
MSFMTSQNILKSLQSLLIDPISRQAPAFLNEPQITVAHGLDFALSNVLGAIVRHGMPPSNIDSLLHVLQMPSIEPTLLTENLTEMFTGGDATHNLIEIGTVALKSIFAQKTQNFTDALAAVSGLTSKSAVLTTSMVTPFVLAAIKRAVTASDPLNVSSLRTVLEAQSLHLKGHVSEKLLSALGLGGYPAWLGKEDNKLHDEAPAVGTCAKQAVAAAKRDVAAHKPKWLWLGLLLLALLALLSLGFCMKRTPDAAQPPDVAASTPSVASAAATGVASAATATVQNAVNSVAGAIPKGAGIVAAMMDGRPTLKIYFDYGKSRLTSEFAEKAKDVLAYLKDNPSSKASVSGFTDSSGDPTLNAELAKKRAESVQAALQAAGIDASRVKLDKPVAVSGNNSDAKDRYVEIHVQ